MRGSRHRRRAGRGSAALVGLLLLVAPGWSQPADFVRVQQGQLVVGDPAMPVYLRGMGMGNYVADLETDVAWLYQHHDITDFQRLADHGMNAVRFYLHPGIFLQNDPHSLFHEPAFTWLQDNIDWAEQTGLYLSLVMMHPPGSNPSQGEWAGFWDSDENRGTFIRLWKEIAVRCADEPHVSSYDLMNEPVVTDDPQQWEDLAQELIDSIRTVDSNHLILVESLYGVQGDWDGDPENPEDCQFLVDDPNVVYDTHFYKPIPYTHWFLWGEYNKPRWPDHRELYLPLDTEWATATSWNPSPPPGTSDWTWYEGELHYIGDPEITIGYPVFLSSGHPGTVWFDDYDIREYNGDGEFLRVIHADEVPDGEDWYHLGLNYDAMLDADSSDGHGDAFSMTISGAIGSAAWTHRAARFEVVPGRAYRICGWMKCEGLPPNGYAQIRLDFLRSPSQAGLRAWTAAELREDLLIWTEFGNVNNVPMNIGEIGVDDDLIDSSGGLEYLKAVIELMIDEDLHFTQHLYDTVQQRPEIFDLYAELLGGPGVALNIGEDGRSGSDGTRTGRRNAQPTVRIHPTPTNGWVTVDASALARVPEQVDVFNLTGRLVQRIAWPGAGSRVTLSLHHLTSGTYLLRLDGAPPERIVLVR